MPGLFSDIFDASSDEGSSSTQQSYDAGADGDIALSPEITVQNEMSGSYQDLDGSETSWQRSDELTVGANVELQAAVDLAADTLNTEMY